MIPRRLQIGLFVGLELLAAGAVAYSIQATRLRPGKAVEGRVRPSQTRIYTFHASRGEYLELAVKQRQADLTITLKDGKRQVLAVADSPSLGFGGTEVLPAVAQESGRYRVEVRLAEGHGATGEYTLVLTTREPSRRDHLRALAASELKAASSSTGAGAAASFKKAVHFAAQSQDRGRVADIRYRRGQFFIGQLQSDLAHKELLLAAGEYEAEGNRLGQAHALDLAGYAVRPRKLKLALELRQEAYDLYSKIGGREGRIGQVKVLGNMAATYDALGSYGLAKHLYERAQEMWPPGHDEPGRIHVLTNMGQLYLSLADLDQARHYFEMALRQIDTRLMTEDLACTKARALGGLGQSYSQEERAAAALSYSQAAFALSLHCEDSRVFTALSNQVGSVYLNLPDKNLNRYLARLLFQRAYVSATKAKDQYSAWNAQSGLAGLSIKEGDTDKAVRLFEQTLAARRQHSYLLGVVGALYGRAQAQQAAGDLEAAQSSIQESLAEMEPLRRGAQADSLSASLFSSRKRNYDLSVSLWMERHRRDPAAGFASKAFEDNERARARTLMDSLGGDHSGQFVVSGRERELSQELELRRQELNRLTALSADSRTTAKEKRIRELNGGIKGLVQTLEALRTGSRTLDLENSAPMTLPEIRAQVLDEETLLLAYWFGNEGEGSYLWAVDRASLVTHAFTPEEVAAIDKLARKVSRNFANRELPKQALGDLSELSRLILDPVAGLLRKRRLLIVADGELQSVPFPALQDPRFRNREAASDGWAGYQPLLERHTVVMLPSASMLGLLRKELAGRAPAPKKVAILADPVFRRDDNRFSELEEPGGERAVGLDGGLQYLRRLENTAEEARAIEALVAPEMRFTAMGFDANAEIVFSGKLAQFEILHFATHGLPNTLPDLAGLALSMVDRNGNDRNGFLHAFQISRMRLPADLVVLSACGTGLGTTFSGEGVFNLSRAFFYAGARRVVVTHWNVDDRATSVLMKIFYEELLDKGLAPSEALRVAQRKLRRLPDWQDPYYWGGFVLQGEW